MNAMVSLPILHATPAAAYADPVFEAIERHRQAHSRFKALIMRDGDDDRDNELNAANDAEDEAACAMVSTENLTPQGALALMKYALALEAEEPECWPRDLVDEDSSKSRSFHYFLLEQVAGALAA